MLRKIVALVLVVLSGVSHATAQTPAQEPVDDVVRITSNLVQFDVVVTDKSGKQVTDLKPEDFEVFEDGHAQPITYFSYVLTGPAAGRTLTGTTANGATMGPLTNPTAPRREHIRRTIAIVVDDLGLAFVSTVAARKALKKFIDEQIQPGDLVALIRTGGEVGALQQFTSDKRLLLAAVERVRWNSCGRSGFTVLAPAGHPYEPRLCEHDSGRISVAALGAVITGMRELPGRKSLIFFADGFPLVKPQDAESAGLVDPMRPYMGNGLYQATNINTSSPLFKKTERGLFFDPVRMLAEMAIRADVVIYTVDTRGLATLAPTAADEVGGNSGDSFRILENIRNDSNRQGRFESGSLADMTGGLFVENTNNLNLGLDRIMEDQKGYYLIGYRPGEETFDHNFHRMTARVKTRPDLKVRTREGFYGLTDDEARPVNRTAADRFQLALMSPFGASDIDVRLRPLFTSLPNVGPVLRSRLRIKAQNLSFKEEAGGWRSAQLVLRALLLGDNGRIVDEYRRAFTVRLRGATFELMQRHGFDYVFDMPAKKPGSYQFRVAIVDTVSSRVGSAAQYVEVPNLKNKQLALSGIALNEAAGTNTDNGPTPATVDAAGRLRQPDVGPNAAARRFQLSTVLSYEYLVFNPGEPTGKRLTTLVQLFRDGKLVRELESPEEILPQTLNSQVLARGRMTLGTELAPGEYVLQITVTDPTAKKGQGTAIQSADFEIIE